MSFDLPLALYMEGSLGQPYGKMGHGVLRYSPRELVCVVDAAHAGGSVREATGIDREVPIVATVDEACAMGARGLVLGIAPPGGRIPEEWYGVLDHAVGLGMALINGLHDHLAPRYPGAPVWDIRVEPQGISTATGAARKLGTRRALFVGTDMAVGKMTAALEVHASAQAAGVRSGFVATGQIGILIHGRGVPLDAVRLDFAAGAIEAEVLHYSDSDLILIEGQGAIIHPASVATLPLMRGSCPTHLILCHRAGMDHLPRVPWVEVPPLGAVIDLYEAMASACGVFVRPKTVGVALNTAHLSPDEAAQACAEIEAETGLPTVDPVRDGAARLVSALMDGEP